MDDFCRKSQIEGRIQDSRGSDRMAEVLARIQQNKTARYMSPVDVGALRRRLGMTQRQFARRFGFALPTLRHWERGDRTARGAALVLLNVIARNPRAVIAALRGDSR